ncbi:MAG: hypothetical protein JHD16_02160 [Solirubrobacteraceae bacterium]|nr:hypothetical protein [Solirubrobacteraceae bacterium]
MRPGRSIALFCLLALGGSLQAAPAMAQDPAPATSVAPPVNPQGDELAPTTPATTPATTPGAAPAPATTPGAVAPVDPAAPAAGATPGPPPFLAPSPNAAVQPVAGVSELTTPEVPLEPLRIAALVAALLAALAVGAAALLRTLGLRSAAVPAVPPVVADGKGSRVRERLSTLADDVRDFLRHSR